MSETRALVVQNKEGLKSLIHNADVMQGIQGIIASGADPKQLLNMILVAASRTPALYRCTKASILQCLMRSAETGLALNGREAAAVPFGTEATFIPMYQGLIKNMVSNNVVSRVEARVVYAEDVFEIKYGTDPCIHHLPTMGETRGSIVGAYAVAFFRGGGSQFDYMPIKDQNGIRDRSRAKSSGPWVTDTEEMYRKTVVRRLAKYIPQTPIMQTTLDYDDEATGFVDNKPTEQTNGKSERLAKQLAGGASVSDDTPDEPGVEDVIDVEVPEEDAPADLFHGEAMMECKGCGKMYSIGFDACPDCGTEG